MQVSYTPWRLNDRGFMVCVATYSDGHTQIIAEPYHLRTVQ